MTVEYFAQKGGMILKNLWTLLRRYNQMLEDARFKC